ncbi:unnamed protein product [Polarella glacialis]|uniref:Uncharacterized protein n=1 Tax=Polarella glacialis TaxID=89957 RepID=A0A813EK99_POLGL|nr:unnamed protein product [Polarella glacialis]
MAALSPKEFVESEEYPGVRWVLANYILLFLKNGQPMPRCQDLPPQAFGRLDLATRAFAVTHPWLGHWHPDPQGIQIETLRAKLQKMKKQMMLEPQDVVFFDYMSLPQVTPEGVDDRTPEEKRRLRAALSGDLMGRVYLTTRVIVIDEVPKEAQSCVPYLERGWCYFECMVASMNTSPRDLEWVGDRVKDQIALFRGMAAGFRESGDLSPMLQAFESELPAKAFAQGADRSLVQGFFASLATSQRLVAAAVRGDIQGVKAALDDGADIRSRNGQGRTALQAAVVNSRVAVVAALLERCDASVVLMQTMEGETALKLAKEAGSLECKLMLRRKLGQRGSTAPLLLVKAIEGNEAALRRLLADRLEPAGDGGLDRLQAVSSAASSAPALPAVGSSASLSVGANLSAGSGITVEVASPKAPGRGGKVLASPLAVAGAVLARNGAASPQAAATGQKGSAPKLAALSAARLVLEAPASRLNKGTAAAKAKAADGLKATSAAAPQPLPPLACPVLEESCEEGCATLKATEEEDEKEDVDVQDDEGNTALHLAVGLRNLAVAEILLASCFS